MTFLAYACCSDLPPCPACPETCDFASSYTVENINFEFEYLVERLLGDGCVQCFDPGDYGLPDSYNIQISGVQVNPFTITRYGAGTCCYAGTGFVDISYTITWEQTVICCGTQTAPQRMETISQSWSGTETVKVCVSVACSDDPATPCVGATLNPSRWVHRLYVCGFPLSATYNTWRRTEHGVPCTTTWPYDEIEADDSLWVAGAVLTWHSPIMDLAAIGPATKTGRWMFCDFPVELCTLTECGTMYLYAGLVGPFGVLTVDAWDPGDPPDGCDEDISLAPLLTTGGVPGMPESCPPCGNDVQGNKCARLESSTRYDRWDYN